MPLDDAYLAELNKVVALPESMTLDQLEAAAQGGRPRRRRRARGRRAGDHPDDLATLAQIAAKPIPLQYVLSFEGTVGVETTTGAEVDVGATEWVGAKPVLADVAALQALIAHYPDVPEAVAAGEALAALSSAPATKLFEYRYQQTPASVADIADEVEVAAQPDPTRRAICAVRPVGRGIPEPGRWRARVLAPPTARRSTLRTAAAGRRTGTRTGAGVERDVPGERR